MDKKQLTKLLREKWKTITVEEKAPFVEQAAKAKERYEQENSAGKSNKRKPNPKKRTKSSKLKPTELNSTSEEKKGKRRKVTPVTDVSGWTSQDVGQFLLGLGLSEYSENFESNGVTGIEFINLRSSDLRDRFGITTIQHRKTIMKAIGTLVNGTDSITPPTLPVPEIGRAVQQECRDRSRMPSSA
eukprot:TRINITY_DN9841_c0_g1_i9.p1 TRINITY_DN9841_c0_g1~~TRINITY_DN9841_c0_g1_i9.p1  ORF type:complete len:186 (+),score=36.26 TRINITY_DN9841_c0_g1_i9:114-671(+)